MTRPITNSVMQIIGAITVTRTHLPFCRHAAVPRHLAFSRICLASRRSGGDHAVTQHSSGIDERRIRPKRR